MEEIELLIEVYKDRVVNANKSNSHIVAHDNQTRVDVLEHLKSVIAHNKRLKQ